MKNELQFFIANSPLLSHTTSTPSAPTFTPRRPRKNMGEKKNAVGPTPSSGATRKLPPSALCLRQGLPEVRQGDGPHLTSQRSIHRFKITQKREALFANTWGSHLKEGPKCLNSSQKEIHIF